VVALLRSVGHVLDSVDGETAPELRRAIDEEYTKLKDSKPAPSIFWEFIHEERNMVLKEYRFRGLHVWGHGITSLWSPTFTAQTAGVTRTAVSEFEHLYVFNEGPFT